MRFPCKAAIEILTACHLEMSSKTWTSIKCLWLCDIDVLLPKLHHLLLGGGLGVARPAHVLLFNKGVCRRLNFIVAEYIAFGNTYVSGADHINHSSNSSSACFLNFGLHGYTPWTLYSSYLCAAISAWQYSARPWSLFRLPCTMSWPRWRGLRLRSLFRSRKRFRDLSLLPLL